MKVSITTLASDMFRVFLFSSQKKKPDKKNLRSGHFFFFFFTLVSRTFQKLDFFSSVVRVASVPHMDCICTANGVCVNQV